MSGGDFRQVSHDVWEAMAPGWDERHSYLEQVARPVTERMLERLEPQPGQTILDVAAGTGVVGFAAASSVGSDGRVIVSDFSESMVEAAERHAARLGHDNVECRVLDAERLDLPDDSVDGVCCRWGYMLMGDPDAAVAESARVLRDGGRLTCAVFAEPQRNPWAAVPGRVLQERGHMPAPEPGAPGIFALADPERLRGLFADAGLDDPTIEEVSFPMRHADTAEHWEFVVRAAGAIAMFIERLDDDERARVREEVAERLAPFGQDGELRMPAVSLVASASAGS